MELLTKPGIPTAVLLKVLNLKKEEKKKEPNPMGSPSENKKVNFKEVRDIRGRHREKFI